MWLKNVKIKNFKSIEDMTINFTPGINIIFGANGTGKTNIVKAILKLLGPTYPGPNSFQKEDHFRLDDNQDILIRLEYVKGDEKIMLKWDKDYRSKKRLILNDSDYITDGERHLLCPLHIPPNREIKDLPGASKWMPIGRIIFELSKMIEKEKEIKNEFVEKMQECVDILVKSSIFSKFKDGLESYSSEQIGSRGENINVKLGLLDHKHILKTLQIFETIHDEQYNLSEGGQGIQSNVTMAALRAFSDVAGGTIFIIADEPEAYLHPLAQQTLCNIFEQIAESGTQIIITTHSPHFISPLYIEGLNKIWMQDGKTSCTKIDIKEIIKMKEKRGIGECTHEGTIARLNRMLSFQVKEGFFAETVVLCEGETEGMSLNIWGNIEGYNMVKDGITIVPANGKFSMIDLAELYRSLQMPVFLIFDSDENKEQNKGKHALQNRWLLEYSEEEIEDFPKTKINKNCCTFSPNFENVLRDIDPIYSEMEKEVNGELGLSRGRQKGIRARYVALKYQEKEIKTPPIIKELLDAIHAFHKIKTLN